MDDNMFERLEIIDDLTVKDALKYAVAVIVDNALTYDVSKIEKIIDMDFEDERDFDSKMDESYDITSRIIIDKDAVKSILEKVTDKDTLIDNIPRDKNIRFQHEYSLTQQDVRSIIQQLDVADYTYSVESVKPFRHGALLTVLITNKSFKLKNKILAGVKLYIKIDCLENGVACVISIHPAEHDSTHYYKED